jgi:hypothetical protein
VPAWRKNGSSNVGPVAPKPGVARFASERIERPLPPAFSLHGARRTRLQHGADFTQDLGVKSAARLDVEMRNVGVARQVDIRELAVEAGGGNERQAPAAVLIVVDGPHDICRDGLLAIRIERHQEVHRNMADLECASDFDSVVASLRVANQDEHADLAGGAIPQYIGDGSRPIQVLAHLRMNALRPEFIGEFVEPSGEEAQPSAQQDRPRLRSDSAVAPQQHNSRDHDHPARAHSRPRPMQLRAFVFGLRHHLMFRLNVTAPPADGKLQFAGDSRFG